jgi:hypothetical protein
VNDTTLIQLARLACGTALLITHVVTGLDGTLTVIAMVLMGIPFEALKRATAEQIVAETPA